MTMEVPDYDWPGRMRSSIRSSHMTVGRALIFAHVDGRTQMRWSGDMRPLAAMRAPAGEQCHTPGPRKES
jgi:hypothetical protein